MQLICKILRSEVISQDTVLHTCVALNFIGFRRLLYIQHASYETIIESNTFYQLGTFDAIFSFILRWMVRSSASFAQYILEGTNKRKGRENVRGSITNKVVTIATRNESKCLIDHTLNDVIQRHKHRDKSDYEFLGVLRCW